MFLFGWEAATLPMTPSREHLKGKQITASTSHLCLSFIWSPFHHSTSTEGRSALNSLNKISRTLVPVLPLALTPPNPGLRFSSNSHSILSEQQQFPLVTAPQFLFSRNSIFSAAGFPNCESLAAFISPSNMFDCNLQFGDLARFLVCFRA